MGYHWSGARVSYKLLSGCPWNNRILSAMLQHASPICVLQWFHRAMHQQLMNNLFSVSVLSASSQLPDIMEFLTQLFISSFMTRAVWNCCLFLMFTLPLPPVALVFQPQQSGLSGVCHSSSIHTFHHLLKNHYFKQAFGSTELLTQVPQIRPPADVVHSKDFYLLHLLTTF